MWPWIPGFDSRSSLFFYFLSVLCSYATVLHNHQSLRVGNAWHAGVDSIHLSMFKFPTSRVIQQTRFPAHTACSLQATPSVSTIIPANDTILDAFPEFIVINLTEAVRTNYAPGLQSQLIYVAYGSKRIVPMSGGMPICCGGGVAGKGDGLP